jgi:hypothetical protein
MATMDPDSLESVVKSLIQVVTFPIPPRTTLREAQPSAMLPAIEPDALLQFVWRWLPLWLAWEGPGGLQELCVFPVPVAIVSQTLEGYWHLISLTTLWHLSPSKTPLCKVLAPASAIWAFLESHYVAACHFIPSSRSVVRSNVPQAEHSDPQFQFHMYMGTPLMALGYVAFSLQGAHCALAVQNRMLDLLKEFAKHVTLPFILRLPRGQILTFTPNEGPKAPGPIVDQALRELKAPRVPDSVGPTGLHTFVWFVFRFCKCAKRMTRACTMVLHQFAQAVELCLEAHPERLREDLDTMPVLPGCASVVADLKKALRGADKDHATSARWLKHSRGLWKPEQVTMGDLTHSNTALHSRDLVSTIVTAYYIQVSKRILEGLTQSTSSCVSCSLAVDASRAFKKDVLTSLVAAGGILAAGPPQILPDAEEMLEPNAALERIALQMAGKKQSGSPGKYKASKTFLLALLKIIFVVMPWDTMSPWCVGQPALAGPGGHRLWAPDILAPGAEACFAWNQGQSISQWCLPNCLRGQPGPGSVQILTLVGDEGSVGWRVFQYLAGPAGLRIMWHSDPAHRMTNVYLNAMKSVPLAFKMSQAVLLVHKYRRAPYGGGKFWKQAQGTMNLLTMGGQQSHELLDMFSTSIAEDLGVDIPDLETDPNRYLAAMMGATGPKVEMRRWWSHYDASRGLLKIWHVLLVSLLAFEMSHGRDPIAGRDSRPASADDSTSFKFKQEVLRVLWNSQYRALLRSNQVIFRALRTHFASYIDDHTSVPRCLEYIQIWASPDTWHRLVVSPGLADALVSPTRLNEAGLVDIVSAFEVPVLQDTSDLGSQEEVLTTHLRQSMSLVFQLEYFVAMYQTPPWMLCLLLMADMATSAIARLKEIWEVVLSVECSCLHGERTLLETAGFTRWHVFREPCLLLEASGWKLPCPVLMSYVEALFQGLTNSMGNENCFNDMRDSERRSAKHVSRSPEQVAGLALHSVSKRYPDTLELQPQHLIAARSKHMAPESFIPTVSSHRAGAVASEVGIDVDGILKNDFPSTSAHYFGLGHCFLLQALLLAPRERWLNLWVCRCFQPHLLISAFMSPVGKAVFYYTLGSSPQLLLALELVELADGNLAFNRQTLANSLRKLPVSSMTAFRCHPYTLAFNPAGPDKFLIRPKDAVSLLEYVLLKYVDLLPKDVMRSLMTDCGLACPTGLTSPQMVERLMTAAGVSGPEAEAMLAKVQALYEKRLRPKQTTTGGLESLIGDPHIGAMLSELAPLEFDFMNGLVPGGRATTEEEQGDKPEDEQEGQERPEGSQSVEPQAQAAGSSSDPIPRFPARLLTVAVPEGCALVHFSEGATCGPQWQGRLPVGTSSQDSKKSCSRSYQSGKWRGCNRTSAAAKAEVIQWLHDAMASAEASQAHGQAEASAAQAEGSQKRQRRS